MDTHHGYLVRAIQSADWELIEEDRFAIRAGAIECARLLVVRGWNLVQCFEVTVVEDDEYETLTTIEFQTPAPKKMRRQMSVGAV